MRGRSRVLFGLVLVVLIILISLVFFTDLFEKPGNEALVVPTANEIPTDVLPTSIPPTQKPISQKPIPTPTSKVRELDGMPETLIPAGALMMGCDPENNAGVDCMPDILPLHKVELSAFYIDKFEVSNAQYARCVTAGKCTEPKTLGGTARPDYYTNPAYADFPVVAVDWNQANAYCRWVGGHLPTEAEWEKAARGDDLRPYPWGFEPPDCSRANFNSNKEGRCSDGTTKVGSYPEGASPYGVMDLAGNVWEWTNDWYDWTYYQSSPEINPMGPENGFQKIVKGGAWDYSANVMTISYNSDHQPQEFKLSFGFRCASASIP